MGKPSDTQSLEARMTALLQGFRERIPRTEEQLLLRGDRMTIAGIHDRLEARGKAYEIVRKTKAAYEKAVVALRETEAEDERFHDAVVRFLRQKYGRNGDRLRPFGVRTP